ncbi:hypothetical protein H5410_058371 [Solanum commersonii]|uniref:Uncharacterized protein n=1 Tax=Solanum commersonii TaxID=4109 RepID=A0A9J5WSH0_SOLCO|nr:hypothetical protein H5410_058371 [Solanum commersonii]
MKHDLLQMEHTALVELKGSVIIWEVKSFEGLSVQVEKRKLLNYTKGKRQHNYWTFCIEKSEFLDANG